MKTSAANTTMLVAFALLLVYSDEASGSTSDISVLAKGFDGTQLHITGRGLHATDVNGTSDITTGSEIIQGLPGAATFSTSRSFPTNQSPLLALVLSLTPAVVSAAFITACLFIISVVMGKTAAWCIQVMLSEVFGMILKFMQTFADPWGKYHPAVPSKRCRSERKKRRRFTSALILTLLVGAVGWLANAGMNELIKKKSVTVKGKAVSGFSVCLTEGEEVVDLPLGCSSVPVTVSGTHPNFGSSSRFEVCYQTDQVQVPPVEQVNTRNVQLMSSDAAERPGVFAFAVTQGQLRYEFKSSAVLATESARLLLQWERAGELGDAEKFEGLLSSGSLFGCANITPVRAGGGITTEWIGKNCTGSPKSSFTSLATAVVSNMAIEKTVFESAPTYLDVDSKQVLQGLVWERSVIGYAEKGRVPAVVPMLLAVLAWLIGMFLAWRMYLWETTMIAGKCMHATLHDGECLKELWELEDVPTEKKYRSIKEMKKVVVATFTPVGYEEVMYFEAGDVIDLVSSKADQGATSQSIKGTHGRSNESSLPIPELSPVPPQSTAKSPDLQSPGRHFETLAPTPTPTTTVPVNIPSPTIASADNLYSPRPSSGVAPVPVNNPPV